ncbi:MAG: YdcH family protein [Methyloligellaceae bacterium]
MSHVPNQLAEEFPEYKDKIHTLKISDNHFVRKFDKYNDINREIHHIEANGINVSDDHFEELKKKRLALKDDIRKMLTS